jgi:hypothetical protein
MSVVWKYEAGHKVGEVVAVPVVFIYGALYDLCYVSIFILQLKLSGIKFLTC